MTATGQQGLAAGLKFWLVEFWGPKWDWHRRLLLLRHFRAYLRHPPIPAEHLPDRVNDSERAVQQAFSTSYRALIEAVQRSAPRSESVHLTYRPLGKNLRLLGTAVRDAVDRGRRLVIRPGGPPSEVKLLARRGHAWAPWLWARDGSAGSAPMDAALAWNELFVNPPARPSPHDTVPIPPAPRLSAGTGAYSREHLETVLKLAAATRYVFSPARETMQRVGELKRAIGWPVAEPVLGMHVRRGDAAASAADSEPAKATRRSFSLQAYLDAADRLCARYDIRHVFLATESSEEIERAGRLRPQYRFLWLDYDRSLFPDIRTSNRFIEDLALEHPERARALAVSGILDLYCFCECHAIVGAFNSEFSVLGWLLAVGSRGYLVPYVSLSRPSPRRHLHPFAALLNLHNNCPLELYHW